MLKLASIFLKFHKTIWHLKSQKVLFILLKLKCKLQKEAFDMQKMNAYDLAF